MPEAEPLILRRRSSRIRTEDRDEYVSYIKDKGVEDYLGTPSKVGCEMLSRDCGDGSAEVSTLICWRSIEAIRAFAGNVVDCARYYPLDDRFLIAKPEFVEHHVIVVEALGLKGISAPPEADIAVRPSLQGDSVGGRIRYFQSFRPGPMFRQAVRDIRTSEW